MSRLTRDGTAEPVSRDQILRHARGQGNIHFPCSADHEQDWQPYPVDPYSAICDDHTYIHTLTPSPIILPSRSLSSSSPYPDDQGAGLSSIPLGTRFISPSSFRRSWLLSDAVGSADSAGAKRSSARSSTSGRSLSSTLLSSTPSPSPLAALISPSEFLTGS